MKYARYDEPESYDRLDDTFETDYLASLAKSQAEQEESYLLGFGFDTDEDEDLASVGHLYEEEPSEANLCYTSKHERTYHL